MPSPTATPEITRLRTARRKAATAAMGSGMKAIRAWSQLEQIERQLGQADPEGDWRREGFNFETARWEVQS